jgi:hypothetical protein
VAGFFELRLDEAGVLSNEACDETKKRILAGHVN